MYRVVIEHISLYRTSSMSVNSIEKYFNDYDSAKNYIIDLTDGQKNIENIKDKDITEFGSKSNNPYNRVFISEIKYLNCNILFGIRVHNYWNNHEYVTNRFIIEE